MARFGFINFRHDGSNDTLCDPIVQYLYTYKNDISRYVVRSWGGHVVLLVAYRRDLQTGLVCCCCCDSSAGLTAAAQHWEAWEPWELIKNL